MRELHERGVTELFRVTSEEMVIYYIYEDSTVQSIRCLEKLPGRLCNGVAIGELVNGPVKGNPILYPWGIIKFLFPFHKIANHISDKNIGLIERQVSMSEIIHGYLK
jgi:hypothetical protein